MKLFILNGTPNLTCMSFNHDELQQRPFLSKLTNTVTVHMYVLK